MNSSASAELFLVLCMFPAIADETRFADDDEYDRHPQRRRRYEEPTQVKLRKMLLSIAESPMKLPEDEAKDIARLLGEHFEEEELKSEFFDMFVKLYEPLLLMLNAINTR